jgi:hypothetical protein
MCFSIAVIVADRIVIGVTSPGNSTSATICRATYNGLSLVQGFGLALATLEAGKEPGVLEQAAGYFLKDGAPIPGMPR